MVHKINLERTDRKTLNCSYERSIVIDSTRLCFGGLGQRSDMNVFCDIDFIQKVDDANDR